jgi:PBP1b-binding outer membrane lipoprotein LpoB
MKLNAKPRFGSLLLGVMLLLLVMLLSGCHALPTAPSVAPAIPTPPVSQLQPPAQTYSSSAAQDIETWQQRLMDGSTKQ